MDTRLQPPIQRRVNVGMGERGVSIAAGLAGFYYLLKRRPSLKIGLPMALDAGYMIYRGATGHCLMYQMLEINRAEEGNKGILAQRSVKYSLILRVICSHFVQKKFTHKLHHQNPKKGFRWRIACQIQAPPRGVAGGPEGRGFWEVTYNPATLVPRGETKVE